MRTSFVGRTAAVVFGVVVCTFAVAADAAVLYRAGDYNGSYAPGGEWPENGNRFNRYFKDFNVPAGPNWLVQSVGNMSAFQDGVIAGQTARWEIRQGLTASSLGTLVATGNGAIVSPTLITTTIGNGPIYDYQVALTTPLTLPAGTYWLTVQPYFVSPSGTQGNFQAFTLGANSVGGPAIDGVSYINSDIGYGQLNNSPAEPAVTVYGVVPEPASLAVLGLAGLALQRRR